jgi:RecQ-mediated genome instability protein 1
VKPFKMPTLSEVCAYDSGELSRVVQALDGSHHRASRQPEVDPEDDPPAPLPLLAPPAPAPPPGEPLANARSPLRELAEPPRSATTRQASRTAHEDEDQPRRRRVPNPPPSAPAPPPPRPSGSSIFFANQSDIADVQDISADRASVLSRERWCSPTRTNTNDTPLKEDSSSDFGDENIVLDDEFLEQVNRAEMEALGDTTGRHLAQATGGSSSAGSSATGESDFGLNEQQVDAITAITIEDDDEDDKENVPVLTRNVRRRTVEVIDISD